MGRNDQRSDPLDKTQDTYQFCRQWTIAVFEHITENDFAVRLAGGSIKVLGAAAYDDDEDGADGSYDEDADAGIDVFFSTVALPAFYSSLPATVGLLDDNYEVMEEVRAFRFRPCAAKDRQPREVFGCGYGCSARFFFSERGLFLCRV